MCVGSPRAIKRLRALMQRRIKWDDADAAGNERDDDEVRVQG